MDACSTALRLSTPSKLGVAIFRPRFRSRSATSAARPAASYLALGGLRGWADADKDGRVTASELLSYVRGARDATLRGRRQTPRRRGSKKTVLGRPAGETGPDLSEPAQLEARSTAAHRSTEKRPALNGRLSPKA